MLCTARRPRSSASPAASAPRLVAAAATRRLGKIARSRRTRASLPLDVHHVAFDANLVGGHVARDGAAQQLARTNVEAGIVQRALDHVAHELARGERRAGVAANVAE